MKRKADAIVTTAAVQVNTNAFVKKEVQSADSTRLPRKKGPRPKRVRRIILKPLLPEEEDALLERLDTLVKERTQNDDPVVARMRRKLALRKVIFATEFADLRH